MRRICPDKALLHDGHGKEEGDIDVYPNPTCLPARSGFRGRGEPPGSSPTGYKLLPGRQPGDGKRGLRQKGAWEPQGGSYRTADGTETRTTHTRLFFPPAHSSLSLTRSRRYRVLTRPRCPRSPAVVSPEFRERLAAPSPPECIVNVEIWSRGSYSVLCPTRTAAATAAGGHDLESRGSMHTLSPWPRALPCSLLSGQGLLVCKQPHGILDELALGPNGMAIPVRRFSSQCSVEPGGRGLASRRGRVSRPMIQPVESRKVDKAR